jgi:hypothetical protein
MKYLIVIFIIWIMPPLSFSHDIKPYDATIICAPMYVIISPSEKMRKIERCKLKVGVKKGECIR